MDSKPFVSVICEYNPFHFGHLFQIGSLKETFGGVVCILSGNIVQRGSVAVGDKYLRARAALESGANLVLELPVPWCCSSARDFASAGVHIASGIGSEYLAFGTEDSLEDILKINSFVSNPDFPEKLSNFVKEKGNLSYPMALSALVGEVLGENFGELIKKPNNILGLEYISAMKGTNLKPFSVRRDLSLASSSKIRSLEDGERILEQLPKESKKVFSEELGRDFPRDGKKLDSFFVGTLRRLSASGLSEGDFYGVSKDLLNKILSKSLSENTVDGIVDACCDKIYTSARVRRAINSIVFSIKSKNVLAPPPFTCVLAADELGREILKKAKKENKINIITKPVHALEKDEETKNAFLFAKSVEDIILLSSPKPESSLRGRTPFIR